jgi:penicillin-insensitive murein endopeptidase
MAWIAACGPVMLVVPVRKSFGFTLIVALCLVASAALAIPPRSQRARERRARVQLDDGTSVSVGRATRGYLRNPSLLEESNWLRYRSGDARFRYGTDEMVRALEQAAKQVANELPGAELIVGDISRERGGRFTPHRSHRAGRDVDIAFYMRDADGAPVYPDRFVRFDGHGKSRITELGLSFDDARNWELVESLLTSEDLIVQYAFVSRALKRRLLVEGRRRGASEEVLMRAETVLQQPPRGGRHDDHFHVRVYCDANDKPVCIDRAPFHAWHPMAVAEAQQLARLDVL